MKSVRFVYTIDNYQGVYVSWHPARNRLSTDAYVIFDCAEFKRTSIYSVNEIVKSFGSASDSYVVYLKDN